MGAAAPLLFGLGAVGPTATGAVFAGTSGLLGAGGAFGLSQALGTFSAITSLAGVGAQSAAQESQFRAQAEADRFNAEIARQNAEIVKGQTAAEVEKADRDRRLRLGANIARAGATGIGIESSFDILQSSASQEELNLLTIKSEGLLKERQFLTSAQLKGAAATSATQQAGLTRTAGRVSKAASVLKTGSNLGFF